ncbi:MAG: hypothetical protein B7Z60_06330 [Ferrovum sp. 37-45-19]|nr:MAG: hypothetical protein B7Z65_04580 [Ferrovum sp. 21-44-67]OYV94064.1 MAG: hypothetical protein B7Z60_06330 [Ferrovum sp. 37-45-19]OZB33953.1 MAG: hypothetical protein B7X47_02265 [Ferrovum sp. 34-44-207]HQU08217.1 hypothetical protein [Candidatus Paceibacterota bacterium]
MMEKLALRRGLFYEGDTQDLRPIYPTPVISPISCAFFTPVGGDEVVFREDSFDPVTRIRRGRLYVRNGRGEWPPGRVDHGHYHPYFPGETGPGGSWLADLSYDAWQANDVHPQEVNGQIVQIGAHGYVTPWRIVGAERIAIGHILLTLRANSLLGVIPELANEITDKEGNVVDSKSVQAALDSLIDAFYRQQATPTVDVARETAKVILTAWIVRTVHGEDLGDAIKKIPGNNCLINWVASIINRLHPRGKSAEQEKRAANGIMLRPVVDEDAEVGVHLVGMLLREIGWLRP